MKSTWNWTHVLGGFFLLYIFNNKPVSGFNPQEDFFSQNCSDPNTCLESETTTSLPKYPSRSRCKNVTLNSDQYQLIENNAVFVTILNETYDDWILTKQGLQVCIPFSQEFMSCKRWILRSSEFQLGKDGLKLIAPLYKRVYEPSDFYLKKNHEEAIVCINTSPDDSTEATVDMSVALGVTWIISAISLVIAGAICVAVNVSTTYRVVLPFYMLNLFVAYVVLIARLFGHVPSITTCLIYGVVLHFSLLSAFFWLNVVAFHVWRSVAWWRSGVRPRLGGFLLAAYILYGWGSPFLISLVSFLVESGHLFADVTWLRPEFHGNCWFGPRGPMLVFFYGPMAAILAANVLFFILTIINIQGSSKYYSCKQQSAGSPNKMVGTALHLIVVMGLCWIMEALSWAIGGDPRYWLFTDLLTGLQGFFVLIVVLVDAHLYKQNESANFKNHSYSDAESNKHIGSDISVISSDAKPSLIQNK